MHLGKISLCDSVAYNIKSDDDKARILQELDQQYGVKVVHKHHDTYDPSRHTTLINSNPHLVCARTNGNPYYLYLTRCNFVNQCILVDKKVQHGYFFPRMILIRLRFADHLFDNTLFDGEMVKGGGDGDTATTTTRGEAARWYFLVGDLLVHRKRPMLDTNIVMRINLVYEILAKNFASDDMDVCVLQVKRYFRCGDLQRMVEDFLPRLPYTCRGVYFKPFFLKFRDVLYNFDDSLIKKIVRTRYKSTANFMLAPPPEGEEGAAPERVDDNKAEEEEEEGVVFWVKHTSLPDVYELHENPSHIHSNPTATNVTMVKPGGNNIACVPDLATSRMLRKTFEMFGVSDAIPMLCTYNPMFQKWTPRQHKNATAV